MTAQPTIFIAMPLFEGWEHVAHTLDTIQRQTYRKYRLLISVDGGDRRSFEACQPFLSDPRFEIVLHQDRLGWEGNMNYLAGQFIEDFFCYWQHDDYCEPSYLEKLVEHALAHPEASATYCDMRIFGETSKILRQPSLTGFALERVLSQISKPGVAAIRCLIRADALHASIPIKNAKIWVLSLARSGEFHRVPELLYFRRIRKRAVSFTHSDAAPLRRWRDSLDWSLAVLKNTYPLVGEDERTRLFIMIVDLIARDRVTVNGKYHLTEAGRDLKVKFVRQFLDEAASAFGWRPYADVAQGNLEQELRKKMTANGQLPESEALLIDAILAQDIVSDGAIIGRYVRQPRTRRTIAQRVVRLFSPR